MMTKHSVTQSNEPAHGSGLWVSCLMSDLRAVFTLWRRDVLRFGRDRSSIFSSLGQPLFFLLIFGVGLEPIVTGLGGDGFDFKQFLFPGILAMTVMFTSVYSAVSVVIDRQFGFLRGIAVAPISNTAVVLGKVAGGSTVALLQGLIMLALAPALGIRLPWGRIPLLVGLILLVAAVMTSLGTLMAIRQRSIAGFHMLMNFIFLPMLFLSGSFFPLNDVPPWMRALAVLNPVTYSVDPLRRALLSETIPQQIVEAVSFVPMTTSILAMAAYGLAFLFAAAHLFNNRA